MSTIPTTPALPAADDLDAVLLDAGNTVVFLDEEAVAYAVTQAGHPVTAAAVRQSYPEAAAAYAAHVAGGAAHEDGWRRLMRELLGRAGVDEGALDEAVSAAREAHDRFNLWRRVAPGVPLALARIRGCGLRVGIVSNSEGHLDHLFRQVGLHGSFDVVVDSALEGVRKPDPVIFHRACERLGVAPERALYAGDLPEVDVDGAETAGLRGVLVDAFGLHPTHPSVPSVAALAAAL